MAEWILASKSPRRKELLSKLGVPFRIVPAEGEERRVGSDPAQIVENLARQKAEEVLQKVLAEASGEDRFILGADTLVVYGGRILGKPKDEKDAVRMLSMLSGQVHQVYTGVCFQYAGRGETRMHVFCERTDVEMYPISEAEVTEYVKTGEPMDKAGAYGIQGRAAVFVRRIDGGYDNVVGLPLARVYQEIRSEFPDIFSQIRVAG